MHRPAGAVNENDFGRVLLERPDVEIVDLLSVELALLERKSYPFPRPLRRRPETKKLTPNLQRYASTIARIDAEIRVVAE